MDNRIKIFIVEDEALIAHEIRRTLEGLGYEICGVCYTFKSAATSIPASDADLFMLDINLGGGPNQNGIDLAGLLWSVNPKPFIFLTAYSDRETIAKATALQPANYLIKPVNPAMLFAAIQLAIARAQDPESLPTIAEDNIPDFFFVKIGARKEKLYWKNVYAVEASKNYVRVFIIEQAGNYPVRGTIAFVLEQLMPMTLRAQFIRLGRSVSLNRRFITSVNADTIECGGMQFENTVRISEKQIFATGIL